MLDQLQALRNEAMAALDSVNDAAGLESFRVTYLGSKGKLKEVMGWIKDVPPADKKSFGLQANELKQAVESAFEQKKAAMGSSGTAGRNQGIDVTEPGLLASHSVGRRHIITRVTEDLLDVCGRMGFEVARGPELEDDEHNFIKLNIHPEHPARDPIDNFYVDNPLTTDTPRMLRSQTSTVQVRVMEDAVANGWGPPIKVVSPGRVYRPDTVDATHSFMFHQLEALYIDQHVSMVDLKTTLLQFARAYFGEDAQVRLRPSFFPFTEPSAEFDMKIQLRPDQPATWVELGGCGMVDPAVLSACGIDPEIWSGFAWGMGIERLAMGKYGIPDIRMLFDNDVRFLKQL